MACRSLYQESGIKEGQQLLQCQVLHQFQFLVQEMNTGQGLHVCYGLKQRTIHCMQQVLVGGDTGSRSAYTEQREEAAQHCWHLQAQIGQFTA